MPPRKHSPVRFEVRVDGDPDAPTARLYDGGQEIGHAQLSIVKSLREEDGVNPFECVDEIQELRRQVGSSTLWVLWRSAIRKGYRGQGGGVLLYEALLRHVHQAHGKPAIIFPEECMDDGSTSTGAQGVWSSLSRRWKSYGRAVASVPLDGIAGENPVERVPTGRRGKTSPVRTALPEEVEYDQARAAVDRYYAEAWERFARAARQGEPSTREIVARLRGTLGHPLELYPEGVPARGMQLRAAAYWWGEQDETAFVQGVQTQRRLTDVLEERYEARKRAKLDPITGETAAQQGSRVRRENADRRAELPEEGYYPDLLTDRPNGCTRPDPKFREEDAEGDGVILHTRCNVHRGGATHHLRYLVDDEAVSGLTLDVTQRKVATIERVFTSPGYRRQGYARALLDYARSVFHNVKHSKDLTGVGARWAQGVERLPLRATRPQWSSPYFDDPGVSEAVVMDLLDARGQPSGSHVRWYGSLSGPDPGERLPFEAVTDDEGVIGDFATLVQAQRALERYQKSDGKRPPIERMRATGAMLVPTPFWRETLARLEETVQQPGVYDEDDWGDPQTDPERLSDALVAAGFTVLGRGSTRLVVALDDKRIAKVAWNPTSNADEMETWQEAKRGGFSSLLNPATATRADNRILVMPRASKVFEDAVPKKYQREVRRIQSDLADLLPDRQDPGYAFNYGLVDGEVRCLDYGS